jgi:hypothetical protein
MRSKKIWFPLLFLPLLVAVSCVFGGTGAEPLATLGPPPDSASPKVILQRLQVDYRGLDGHRLIGSGCPGNDGRGSIENVHFVVHGVDTDRQVQRVLVAGDNSTLTWEWPCTDDWGLLAQDVGGGTWDVFIAPSLPTETYTLIFFYDDNTFALGMATVADDR